MFILILISQAFCPAEDAVYQTISRDWYSKPVYHVMKGISYAGHPLIGGGTSLVLYAAEEYPVARHSYIGLFFNCATVIPLRFVVNRQRPSGKHGRWGSSFPSGHTTFAFTQAYVLSHHYPRATIPLFTFATAIGFSRIYLKKHHPTDVLAGIALGLVTGFVATKLID